MQTRPSFFLFWQFADIQVVFCSCWCTYSSGCITFGFFNFVYLFSFFFWRLFVWIVCTYTCKNAVYHLKILFYWYIAKYFYLYWYWTLVACVCRNRHVHVQVYTSCDFLTWCINVPQFFFALMSNHPVKIQYVCHYSTL